MQLKIIGQLLEMYWINDDIFFWAFRLNFIQISLNFYSKTSTPCACFKYNARGSRHVKINDVWFWDQTLFLSIQTRICPHTDLTETTAEWTPTTQHTIHTIQTHALSHVKGTSFSYSFTLKYDICEFRFLKHNLRKKQIRYYINSGLWTG